MGPGQLTIAGAQRTEARAAFQGGELDLLADAVVAIDARARVTAWNTGAERLYGIPAERALGQPLSSLYTYLWNSPEEERAATAALSRCGEWCGENVHVLSGGERRDVESSVRVLRTDQGEAGMVAVIRDVTLRKRQREQVARVIRESEQRLAALLAASSDVVYRMSPDWSEMHQLLGREFLADTARSTKSWLEKYIHPEDHPRVRAAIEQAIRSRSTFEFEHRVLRRDGTLGWTFSRAVPILDADGAVTEWVGTATDVTERKRAEAALRESEAALDAFFAHSPGILNLNDEELRYVKTDAITPTYFGLTRESLVGRSVKELAPDFERRFGPMLRTVLEEGVAQLGVEVSSPVPDRPGEIAHWHASYFPVPLPGGRRGIGVMGVEITELKQAQAALREAHERLRVHVETTPLALLEWDEEYRLVGYSRRAEELFGWSAAEVLGRRIDEIPWVPEEDWPAVRAVMRDMSSGARPTNVNSNRNVTKDGRTLHCEWYNSTRYDGEGKAVSVLSLVLDVTARVEAEQARARADEELRRAHAALAAISQSTPVLVALKDRHSRLVYANPAVLALNGRSAEDNYGHDDVERLGRELGAPIIENDRRVMRTLTTETLEEGSPDGRTWLATKSPWVDPSGEVLGVIVVGHDITDRKRAERALREQQQILQSTMDHFPAVIAYKDLEGRFVDVNHAVERVLGRPRAEIVGRSVGDFFSAETGERMRELDREVVASRHALSSEEVTPTPAGTLHHLDIRFPLIDGAGKVYGVGHISQDITALKRAEEELLAANERLRESDRRKDEFLAVLSHELRNPLSPIHSSLYLLERLPADGPQAARAREVIRRQADHLTRLVEDLLDVTRISRGKVQLQRARTDLVDLVRRTVEDQRVALERAELTLRTELPEGPLVADVDATRIAQVLGNLLTNAAKFSDPRGVVTVRLLHRELETELSVEDTGVGIGPEQLARTFEPFSQEARSVGRSRGGLGLGLALSRGLAEAHGGTLTASSAGPGRGTTFTLRLPLPPVAPDTKGASGKLPTHQGAQPRRRVLLIDDNADAAAMLRDVLELYGHEVKVAPDGGGGIALARVWVPDVVFCDIGLSDVSGYEVARTLRADETLRRTRLLALSGYGYPEDKRRSAEAGFERHFTRPASVDELIAALSDRVP